MFRNTLLAAVATSGGSGEPSAVEPPGVFEPPLPIYSPFYSSPRLLLAFLRSHSGAEISCQCNIYIHVEGSAPPPRVVCSQSAVF